MIGKIGTGKSAYHLIRYCLQDKRELSEEVKAELSQQDQLQHKQRAEVLGYNNCVGDLRELNVQFREVEKLSTRTEKPVFHISLRLAQGDSLSNQQWLDIAQACAKEFDFEDHQYLTILHRDTKEPHIHIIANRVGYDGKAASDSKSYKRMAALCRRMEKQYGLTEVLSPKAFLPPAERNRPRQDQRRQKLADDIRKVLSQVKDFTAFEQAMERLGYQVDKGRGIAFIDDKKVRTKGSEVGFSLATIDKILFKNSVGKMYIPRIREENNQRKPTAISTNQHKKTSPQGPGFVEKGIDILLSPEYNYVPIPYELTGKKKKKKKKTID
jgi:hypothetical protein